MIEYTHEGFEEFSIISFRGVWMDIDWSSVECEITKWIYLITWDEDAVEVKMLRGGSPVEDYINSFMSSFEGAAHAQLPVTYAADVSLLL